MRLYLQRISVPLKVFGVFLLGQIMSGILTGTVSAINGQEPNYLTMAAALLIANLITVLLLVKAGLFAVPRVLPRLHPKWYLAILASAFIVFSMNMWSEWMQLSDMVERLMLGIVREPLGMIAIGILGPVVEEMVFRHGIEGGLMRGGFTPWTAIITSSLVFSIAHVNPAQVPFAFALGVVFGIIYWKTGNILLTSIIHILNNSISVLQMLLMGEDVIGYKMTEGMEPSAVIAGGVVLTIVGLLLLRYFCVGLTKEEKTFLREEIKRMKEAYDSEELEAMSDALCSMVIMLEQWQQAKTVLLYHALNDEVGTGILLDEALHSGKRVLLPVVVGDKLELREYTGERDMKEGAYGIMEPTGENLPKERYGEIDFAVVPGVAFDGMGNRLGRGKGYYDGLLPLLTTALTLGLCFPFQHLTHVPSEPNDVKVSGIF